MRFAGVPSQKIFSCKLHNFPNSETFQASEWEFLKRSLSILRRNKAVLDNVVAGLGEFVAIGNARVGNSRSFKMNFRVIDGFLKDFVTEDSGVPEN